MSMYVTMMLLDGATYGAMNMNWKATFYTGDECNDLQLL